MSSAIPDDPGYLSPPRDAQEVGCSALLEGYAIHRESGHKVHATSVRKEDGPFICPGCLSDVILRNPWKIRDHFAHHARLSPLDTSRESWLHWECKREIFESLRQSHPSGNWLCDTRRTRANKSRGRRARQPDIAGRIKGRPVVIEIQKSAIGIRSLIARTRDYEDLGVHVLWVVPLTKGIGDEPFRPRLLERYLHTMYYGRVYYWLPGMSAEVLPVHFSPTSRPVPLRTNESGHWEDAGWIERPYKIIKRPNCFDGTLSILRDFKPDRRREFLPWGEKRPVPPAFLWKDKARGWWPRDESFQMRKCYPSENGEMNDEET